jgi:hypothetical protein
MAMLEQLVVFFLRLLGEEFLCRAFLSIFCRAFLIKKEMKKELHDKRSCSLAPNGSYTMPVLDLFYFFNIILSSS